MEINDTKGKKVRALYTIKGHGPIIPAGWTGRIVRERDNGLGQMLVYVLWDETGENSPVFPEDLEFL